MNHNASLTTTIISGKSKSALHLCFYHIYSEILDLILDKQKKKKKKRRLSLNMLEYMILLHQYLHILYSLCYCDSMRLTRNIPASLQLLAYCEVSASCWSCRVCKAFSGTGGSHCWHCLAPVTPSWTYCTSQSDSEFCFTTLSPMYQQSPTGICFSIFLRCNRTCFYLRPTLCSKQD